MAVEQVIAFRDRKGVYHTTKALAEEADAWLGLLAAFNYDDYLGDEQQTMDLMLGSIYENREAIKTYISACEAMYAEVTK